VTIGISIIITIITNIKFNGIITISISISNTNNLISRPNSNTIVNQY